MCANTPRSNEHSVRRASKKQDHVAQGDPAVGRHLDPLVQLEPACAGRRRRLRRDTPADDDLEDSRGRRLSRGGDLHGPAVAPHRDRVADPGAVDLKRAWARPLRNVRPAAHARDQAS